MDQPLPPAIFLMGPTAAGKTALALALHQRLPVEIVSVDSSQIYRGMDIGTAKPTAAEQARAPHRLIDIRDPAERYSAAQFRADALREMAAIVRGGRTPLLVGGSMFYFRALERGLAPLPGADAALRAQLAEEAGRLGWPALHARLARLDPPAAARIGRHDRQRIQRALEIATLTGQAPSRLLAESGAPRLPYRAIKLALCPAERATLHRRIERRFQAMLEQGLVAEVERLYRRGDLSPELPSIRTVGYRQTWLYLTGTINYCEMVAQAMAATRQFAKRQLTWLRTEPGLHWLDGDGGADAALRYLDGRLSGERLYS
jgi:tRNA dimethylallyltransferase